MPRSRRALLSTLAVGGLTLAGCVGRPGSPTAGSAGAPNAPTSTPTDAPETTTSRPTDDDLRGPVRGEAEPVSVERTIRDEDFEYLPERDAVRYVAKYERGTPVYSTMSFERWGRIQSADVGAERVRAVLAESLDDMEGVGTALTNRGEGLTITVGLNTTRDRDGEVIREPSVGFERVVSLTPRTVDATVWLDDREHRESVDVWVERRSLQLL